MKHIVRFLHNETGATAIEYCLIAALISIAAIAAFRSLGSTTSNTFNAVASGMKTR